MRVVHIELSVSLLLAVAGCSNTATVGAQGTVETGGSSIELAFVRGLGGPADIPDVAVISETRGNVDLLTKNADGSWRLMGSFFAGGLADEVVAGQLGSRGVVAVRDQGGSVALLNSIPDMPHRLDFPIIAYRRVRNGQPVDQTPPARGIALADLDGDGKDELIVGSDLGVAVVADLEQYIGANPEKPPPGNGFRFDAGPQPSAVAAIDIDGDKRKDLLVLDDSEASLRIYHNAGGPSSFASPAVVALPSPGRAVLATGCDAIPAAVILTDGSMVTVSKSGEVKKAAQELTPVKHAASSGVQLAVASGASQGGLALFYACNSVNAFLGVPVAQRVALAPIGTGYDQEMALLAADGKTVSLFQLSGY